MSSPCTAVPFPVKSSIFAALTLFVCAPLLAVEVDPKLDRAVRDALPVCSDVKVSYDELPVKLPTGFSGRLVRVESSRQSCDGQFAAVLSPGGGFFLGMPWLIGEEEGATLEQKFANFTWRNMQEQMKAVIDRTARTKDGLYPVTLEQLTENGRMILSGEVDPNGQVFFFGHFRTLNDPRAARLKHFEPFLAGAPAKGAPAPAVTIVEFSDFQCPSCQRASGWVDTILAKHGDKVRYVRYDLPLTAHAWAFPAALAGRAIYRQNPEAFWDFKKQVYANQAELNAFTFWDFARAFAEDHDLDMKKYDADLRDEELKATLLKGAGAALSNDIRATPSYLVNGALVDAGDGGKALAEYVDKLLQ